MASLSCGVLRAGPAPAGGNGALQSLQPSVVNSPKAYSQVRWLCSSRNAIFGFVLAVFDPASASYLAVQLDFFFT